MAERGRPRGFDRDVALGHAIDVFWAKGFEGASMNDLTTAMGIASPSLYAAFGSKEALFHDAVGRYVDTDGASVWQVVAAANTAYDAAEGLLMESARAFTRKNKPTGCMVILSAVFAAGSPAIRDDLVGRRKECTRFLARKLAEGMETGEIAPTTDVEALAVYLMTVQQGMSLQARDGASRATLIKTARTALAGWEALTGNTRER
ncbi:MAG: TetR/AcrR family transcriptional regulator [Cupriavidus sp.]|nr:MAG: TetR/AcrR family transcriptional regulator [Cupriavidus sp.]